MVERQPEPAGDLGLNVVHFGAIVGDRLAGLGGGQFGRGAVFVGGADEHHLMAAGAGIAGKQIGRQLAAHQVAQMLDPVDVRNGGSDQYPCHGAPFCSVALRLPQAADKGQTLATWVTEVPGFRLCTINFIPCLQVFVRNAVTSGWLR